MTNIKSIVLKDTLKRKYLKKLTTTLRRKHKYTTYIMNFNKISSVKRSVINLVDTLIKIKDNKENRKQIK